ncbi:type 4a pilus biogenesis protein PilO [Diaminobutyricimonas sp. TR449]|uniref:type 4a pilus biogenesis protein PilO n=1 Tax=Diaminobutyricimonas sp. TR449 TaxID=2708076 RepID=UPI0014228FE6|nr:type 4a pilus biogenesis protein PilO [Diaminobutyricimonas sp. TR449]
MNRSRLWIIGSVLVIIALVALGWFAGIGPRLAEARQADVERESVLSINAAHEATLAELKVLDKKLPALRDELTDLRAALPEDAAISTLLGQLNAIAEQNGVQLTSFTAETPAQFAAAVAPAPVPDATDAAETEPTPSAPVIVPIPVGSSEFVTIPVSVAITGTSMGVEGFIESLQFGSRLVLVTDLVITTDASGGTSMIEGFIYVLRDQAQASPAAATTEPEAQAQQ